MKESIGRNRKDCVKPRGLTVQDGNLKQEGSDEVECSSKNRNQSSHEKSDKEHQTDEPKKDDDAERKSAH